MRQAWLILALAGALGCSRQAVTPASPTAPAPTGPVVRVLMLTATAGFRHDAIATARDVLSALAPANGFTISATEDLSRISTAGLSDVDVVMFALTSGELPFTPAQRTSLIDAINGGKGFIGIHSATDTLYEFPDYGRLVGAYFKEHPWTRQGRVLVEDASHPAAGVRDAFTLEEEFYTFRENPRGRVQVLMRLDASSVGASGDFPLVWAHTFGNGRAYYNALGHFPATWRDSRFQAQLIAAIRWTGTR
jgi:type 1 glutamine amidotransferase